MGYRLLADENVERATIDYLRKLNHDIERIGDVFELGLGADDTSMLLIPKGTTVSYLLEMTISSPG